MEPNIFLKLPIIIIFLDQSEARALDLQGLFAHAVT